MHAPRRRGSAGHIVPTKLAKAARPAPPGIDHLVIMFLIRSRRTSRAVGDRPLTGICCRKSFGRPAPPGIDPVHFRDHHVGLGTPRAHGDQPSSPRSAPVDRRTPRAVGDRPRFTRLSRISGPYAPRRRGSTCTTVNSHCRYQVRPAPAGTDLAESPEPDRGTRVPGQDGPEPGPVAKDSERNTSQIGNIVTKGQAPRRRGSTSPI